MLLLQLRIMIIELDVECILSLLFLRSTRYIYCEISVHGCHENLLFTHVFAVLQVKLRLQTYYQNIDSLLSTYEDVIVKVKGDATKEDVFSEIDKLLSSSLDKKTEIVANA